MAEISAGSGCHPAEVSGRCADVCGPAVPLMGVAAQTQGEVTLLAPLCSPTLLPLHHEAPTAACLPGPAAGLAAECDWHMVCAGRDGREHGRTPLRDSPGRKLLVAEAVRQERVGQLVSEVQDGGAVQVMPGLGVVAC